VTLQMTNDLNQALDISASGMDAQSARLRVIAQNLANLDTTGSSPGADPYRRKTVTFESEMDHATGAQKVHVKSIDTDKSDLPLKYDPSNPAANAAGYVKTPNVNSFIEMMDMREAEQGYNANLATMQATRGMFNRTLDILK
jgi:flagellar basal-body rod protein FlgC